MNLKGEEEKKKEKREERKKNERFLKERFFSFMFDRSGTKEEGRHTAHEERTSERQPVSAHFLLSSFLSLSKKRKWEHGG